ncbi:DNA-binding response OmpR family regulator [Chitinophaga skermanii]|uniref:DNA-binding response OmpR family regulator n=1 Tax=Chitinophaga skermanii TaxID=331697 RepID=A0A327R390_9BACT|nr:response regulator transcription factor [Chitinophaga skermanii]RAJ10685.1 DNA-binding response OmpR family regulator [Chitinophaga skermanii]
MSYHVLLVEDEADLGNLVKQYLELQQFSVSWVSDAHKVTSTIAASETPFHIVLLDVNLPGKSGFDLSKDIRQLYPQLPFLFLTARNEKEDRLAGLRLGADDYIVKPFDAEELVLRMSNIIKRNQASQHKKRDSFLQIGQMRYQPDSLTFTDATGKEIIFTQKESDLLLYLFHNANKVLKREEILSQVWGTDDYIVGRSLDVFVSRFRKYFRQDQQVNIRNVYGIGFMFSVR